MSDKISRRAVLMRGLQIPVGGALLFGLGGCGGGGERAAVAAGEGVCADPNVLSDADLGTRGSLNYTETSPDPAKVCGGCAFFHAPAAGGDCGTCDMFSGGPVNSRGHCSSWNAKT